MLVNLAMTDGLGAGYITADKCSALQRGPQTKASGNHLAIFAIANLSVVPVDADGSFCIYNQTEVNLVVDLQGAFVPDAAGGPRVHAAAADPQDRHPRGSAHEAG